MDTHDIPPLVSAQDVADRIGVDDATVYRWANDGEFPDGSVFGWGGRRRFRLDLILAAGQVDMAELRRQKAAREQQRPAPKTTPTQKKRAARTSSAVDAIRKM